MAVLFADVIETNHGGVRTDGPERYRWTYDIPARTHNGLIHMASSRIYNPFGIIKCDAIEKKSHDIAVEPT